MSYFVYILQLRSGHLYVGSTNDLKRRIAEHRDGRGGRTTAIGKVRDLIYSEEHSSRSAVEARELQFKRWSRAKKLALASRDKTELFLRAKRKTEQEYLKRARV